MAFTDLSVAQLLANWLSTYRTNTNTTSNLKPGAIALALGQADVQQAVVLQFIADACIAFARASTSLGPDLDSFYAQFKFSRLPAKASSGLITFYANPVNPQTTYIPVGTQISNASGGIVYEVIADSSNDNYQASTNSYLLPANTDSVNVTVQAMVTGSAYNVQQNQLQSLSTSIYGISSVNNVGALITGEDAELDPNYRARFVSYIDNLSKGTEDAILAAVQAVQSGLKVQLFEQVYAVGNPVTSFITSAQNPLVANGNFVVLADDGSGSPSQALQNAIFTTLFGNVRAYGVRYQVAAPQLIMPQIILPVRLTSAGVQSIDFPIIQKALIQNLNALPIGGNAGLLYAADLITIAQAVDPNIEGVNLPSLTIAGSNNDFTIQPWQELFMTASNVSLEVY